MRRKSFNGFIYDFTHKFKNNIAFRYRPEHELEKEKFKKYVDITFKDLYINILKNICFFEKEKIENKKIALIGRNSYIWTNIMLTSLSTENILVPLDKELKYQECKNSLIKAEADIIFFDTKYEDQVLKLKEELNLKAYSFDDIKEYIFNDNIDFDFEKENINYINNIEKLEKKYEEYENKKGYGKIKDCKKDFEKDISSLEDIKVMLFTSGTTSMSKLVLISRENLLTNTYDICDHENLESGLVEIALLPTHHILGLTCTLVSKNWGTTTTYPDSLKKLASNFKEYKISIFVGVPLILEAIYSRIKKTAIDSKKWTLLQILRKVSTIVPFIGINTRRKLFKSVLDPLGGELKYVISGAAALNPEVANFFKDIGIIIFPGYGLSETSPVISAQNPLSLKQGSVGLPVKNVEVKIDKTALVEHYKNTLNLKDPKSIQIIEKVKNGKEGEIIIRGKSVFKGYYKDLQKTKDAFINDTYWFKTGDIGFIDKDGVIYITGRMKDMIVLDNGKKAFPEEIEYLINEIPEVIESFVFATDKNIGFGSNGDLKIYAKIYYDETSFKNEDINEIYNKIWQEIKKINKTLPSYKTIRGILLTKEAFTKTTTQKIKRFIEQEKIEKEFS